MTIRFEHTTSYFPLPYQAEEQGGMWIFKTVAPPVSPNPGALLSNKKFTEHIQSMGQDGWELVSVQPALQGVHAVLDKSTGAAVSYSITAGYFFFWKRQSTADGQ